MLELRDLSRRYGQTVALDGLSLAVPDGEVVGFVGPNGAGKTTAMRIALGVLEPDAGDVLLARRAGHARAAARRSATCPRSAACIRRCASTATCATSPRCTAATTRRRRAAARWIERLGIAERAEQRIEELSLGNQQRVQLAAALVHDPPVLILDEPFSGLDPIGTDVMSEVLAERAARRRRGDLLLPPARARRAHLRSRGDRQPRAHRRRRAASTSCARERSRPRLRVEVEGARQRLGRAARRRAGRRPRRARRAARARRRRRRPAGARRRAAGRSRAPLRARPPDALRALSRGRRAMSFRRAVMLVTRREFGERIRHARVSDLDRSSPSSSSPRSPSRRACSAATATQEYTVGAQGSEAVAIAESARASAQAYDIRLEVKRFADAAQARAAAQAEDVDAAIVGDELVSQGQPGRRARAGAAGGDARGAGGRDPAPRGPLASRRAAGARAARRCRPARSAAARPRSARAWRSSPRCCSTCS